MTHTSNRCLLRRSLTLAAAALGFLQLPALAQTIPNPSFEADTYLSFPGYAAGNGGVITGWTSTVLGSVGLNPGGGSPFADNGTVPAGANVAFLQSTAGTDLGTTISGLTAGESYRVSFRANARAGNNANLNVSIDSVAVMTSMDFAAPAASQVVNSVNSANPYHYVEFTFTAAAATAALGLLNDAAGDNTLCVDDFQITAASTPVPAGIVASRWTGDADSGVDSAYRYTHARTFGGAPAATTLNGVIFSMAQGGNPGAANVFTASGFGNAFGTQTRAISGSSNLVAQSFVYGGPATAVTLNGLKPNTTYVATIYGVGWEDGTRAADFSVPGAGPSNVNLDAYGVTNGIKVQVRYTTDGAGSPVTVNYPQAAGAGSFHTAALSNREAAPGSTANTWSAAAWTDNASSGINDGGTYIYTHAYNLGSSAGATINGVNFTGVAGGNPSGPNFSISNWANAFANDANNVTDAGGSRTLANDFIWNGFPGSLTLTGLTPGENYVLTLFSVGWDPPGQRVIAFQGYEQTGAGAVIDQDVYDNDNGVRISYAYTAPASGNLTITSNPMQNASFHMYGFANRKAAPETVLAVTTHPQPVYVSNLGDPATFTASASGILPLTYQWNKNGNPIPGETGTTNLSATLTIPSVGPGDVDDYTCSFTGSGGQGTVTSNPAHLYLITDRVAGLFDTGVGANCAVLADGGNDPHYRITVNADGAPIQAVVHDGNVFPIVAGPWVANSAMSKWVSPRFDSSGAAGFNGDGGEGAGNYVYRTTFNLTGFDLSTVRITGTWATDNEGLNIRVNGVATGITNTAQFVAFTPFALTTANAALQAGENTLEFVVQNQDVAGGYTALRVEGLQGFGAMNAGTAPYIAAQPADTSIAWGSSDTLCVSAAGSAALSYQWCKGTTPVPGANSAVLTITADDVSKAGVYTCKISNGSGSITSSTATVSFTGIPLIAANGTIGVEVGASGKILLSDLLAGAVGTGTISFAGLQGGLTSAGGSVSLADGWIVYEPAPGYTGADSFVYYIEDSNNNTAAGTITVAIGQHIGQTNNSLALLDEGAGKRAVFLGIPGRTYEVQISSDLTNWSVLNTQVCPASGVISVLDPGPLPPSRFYRSVQAGPPPP